MNYLDIIFLIPLLWGFYKGITRGLIVEAATLAAFFCAIWVALHFSGWLGNFIHDTFDTSTQYLPLIAFSVLFLGVLILVFFVARLAERIVKAGGLSWLNKIVGAVFGVLKFSLILSLVIFIYEAVERSYPMIQMETKTGSLLYAPISKVAPTIIPGLKDAEITKYIPEPPDTLNINVKVAP